MFRKLESEKGQILRIFSWASLFILAVFSFSSLALAQSISDQSFGLALDTEKISFGIILALTGFLLIGTQKSTRRK